MFITMPIKSFELDGNKVKVNESVIEYEDISADTREILESLISKGAYGSALLTLNMFYNVKSINESDYTQEDYERYLGECNNLMEECVVETEARDFRPLINLKGLEIMESADHIARGKGNKLLIEDFRNLKTLKEQDITMNEDPDEGWGDDVEDLTAEFFDFVDRVDYEIKNARRGSYAGIGTSIDDLAKAFSNISDMATELSETFSNAEVNYSSDEDMNESTKVKERPTGNSRADEIVFEFSQTERDTETFTKALNEISRMEFDNQIDKDKYDECIKKIQDLFVHKDKSIDDLKEEVEGTQCSDIAEKKDQEVGSLQKPKKPIKHFTEMFNVPKNHGFRGFRLNEQGHYVRGKYILINEDGSIKAVNKNKLNETIANKSLKTKDEYGNIVLDYEYAEKLMFQVVQALNEKFKDYGYEFDFRIEEDTLKLFDTNEYFDYEDNNYENVEQVVKQVIGDNHIYLEPENRVIMTIAGCYVK